MAQPKINYSQLEKYNQGGTGAVDRDLESKLQETVSVKDYGAVGDGVTDDTSAIQAAIDSVEAALGGTVFFPTGVYRISSTLTIDTNDTWLIGSSRARSVIRTFESNGTAVKFFSATTGENDFVTGNGIVNLSIQRVTDATSGAGIHLVQTNAFTLDKIAILNFPEGLKIEGGKEGTFSNFRVTVSNAVITGTPVSNSSALSLNSAPTDGATRQDCFTMQFSNFVFSGGNYATEYGIELKGCDVINFVNGYLNVFDIAGLHAKPAVSGISVFAVALNNVYFDDSGIENTQQGIFLEDDGFAGVSKVGSMVIDSSCTVNAAALGFVSSHPAIRNVHVDPSIFRNIPGANVTVTGDDRGFVGIPSTWTPTITFDTPGDLNVVYSTQVGKYIRTKHNTAILHCEVQTSTFTHTTASGNLRIEGLDEFSANKANNSFRNGNIRFQGITKANYTQFSPTIGQNQVTVLIGAAGSGQSQATVTALDVPSGGTVILQFTLEYELRDVF